MKILRYEFVFKCRGRTDAFIRPRNRLMHRAVNSEDSVTLPVVFRKRNVMAVSFYRHHGVTKIGASGQFTLAAGDSLKC